MVREISGPGFDSLGRARKTDRSNSRRAQGNTGEQTEEKTAASSELPTELHAVLEKLQEGKLVTSDTVRQAAERILQGGV